MNYTKKIFIIVWVFGFLAGISFAQDTAGGLTVSKLAVGNGVENRELVGEAQSFPASTEKVYCFLDAKDIASDMDVIFVWYRDEKKVNETTLTLRQGSRWRTWALKTVTDMTGNWKIELKDTAGNVLSSVTFKVE